MYANILVPVHTDLSSERAVDAALEIANYHDAQLTLLAVVDEYQNDLRKDGLTEEDERLAEKGRKRGERQITNLLSASEVDDLDVEYHVESGVAFREITDYVESNDIDLVVMEASSQDGILESLFGSTTDRIVRRTDVPVLLV
jgi:nucleotide-binding universal stress UspA family protein